MTHWARNTAWPLVIATITTFSSIRPSTRSSSARSTMVRLSLLPSKQANTLSSKTLAFTAEEARPLVAAAEASGLVAIIGYMKLYDPGYRLGLEQLARIGRPKMIQVHDFAGRFDRYQQLYTQIRGTDVDPALLKVRKPLSLAVWPKRWVTATLRITIST